MLPVPGDRRFEIHLPPAASLARRRDAEDRQPGGECHDQSSLAVGVDAARRARLLEIVEFEACGEAVHGAQIQPAEPVEQLLRRPVQFFFRGVGISSKQPTPDPSLVWQPWIGTTFRVLGMFYRNSIAWSSRRLERFWNRAADLVQ
jgi:hypothetical protein